jgi:hypothetical protein
VATPQFFQQTLAQRKKAKNSIKLKAAVKTSGPKALICTSQFKDQYPDTFAVWQLPRSEWHHCPHAVGKVFFANGNNS